MARSMKLQIPDEMILAFARRLNAALRAKGWNQSDLAREMGKHLNLPPNKYPRHLVSAYSRGDNIPTDLNLDAMAKALGMKAEDLLGVQVGGDVSAKMYASATSGLDGGTRLVVDANVDHETALKVLGLLREAEAKQNATLAKRAVKPKKTA